MSLHEKNIIKSINLNIVGTCNIVIACKKLNIKLKWTGKGESEKGIDQNNKKIIVEIDKKYFRPSEVDFLKGDFSKAKKLLKWKPIYKTDDLIEDMISSELENS